jgi:Zn-dependent peptidase ImmA (M78 family)
MFKAPHISNEHIESKANQLLLQYFESIQKPIELPVPVEDIAEFYLGYALTYTTDGIFSDPDVLGGICFDNQTIFINMSVEAHEGRHAFTIAHEVGHHVLHSKHFTSLTELLCRNKDKPNYEIQADRFAAALLLPSKFIKDNWVHSSPQSIFQAYSLGKAFLSEHNINNVSLSMFTNRMIELGYFTHLDFQRGKPKYKRQHFVLWKIKQILHKFTR